MPIFDPNIFQQDNVFGNVLTATLAVSEIADTVSIRAIIVSYGVVKQGYAPKPKVKPIEITSMLAAVEEEDHVICIGEVTLLSSAQLAIVEDHDIVLMTSVEDFTDDDIIMELMAAAQGVLA